MVATRTIELVCGSRARTQPELAGRRSAAARCRPAIQISTTLIPGNWAKRSAVGGGHSLRRRAASRRARSGCVFQASGAKTFAHSAGAGWSRCGFRPASLNLAQTVRQRGPLNQAQINEKSWYSGGYRTKSNRFSTVFQEKSRGDSRPGSWDLRGAIRSPRRAPFLRAAASLAPCPKCLSPGFPGQRRDRGKASRADPSSHQSVPHGPAERT